MTVLSKIIPITLFWFFISCDGTGNITGSDDVSEISYVSFSDITTSITENTLVANGTIRNDSQTLNITPPWYIECQFYYSDTTGNTFLIGGESIRINNSLSPNISLQWSIEYQINNPENYYYFTINDLRAYKQ